LSEEYLRFLLNALSLIVVLLVTYIFLKFKGIFGQKFSQRFLNKNILVLDRIFLTKDSQLLLLKVNERIFLIFSGRENAYILKEWDDEKNKLPSFNESSSDSPK
jgi:flagellar biogenesis protein FliO